MKKRGYFAIGVYHPKTEENIGTLWRACHLYNADFIFTIGSRYKKQASDTTHASKHIPLFNFMSIEDFENHLPDQSQIVCIELSEKSISLPSFQHPERAIYLLGAEDYGLPQELIEKHKTIVIPTNERFSMNVAMAGSIVLYDRHIKAL